LSSKKDICTASLQDAQAIRLYIGFADDTASILCNKSFIILLLEAVISRFDEFTHNIPVNNSVY